MIKRPRPVYASQPVHGLPDVLNMERSETERLRSWDKPPYPVNPQKHQQGLLRLELIRAWKDGLGFSPSS